MKLLKLYTITLLLIVLCGMEAKSQCSVSIVDSLLPGLDLQLVGVATGVAPFTYTWTVTGLATGPINYQSNSTTGGAGDSILIGAASLFGNYGCINVTLCITDSVGCSNCILDTLLTVPETVICFANFTYTELSPGTIQINFPNPVPPNIGSAFGTYTDENGGNQVVDNFSNWTFTYTPSTIDTNGYDVSFCVQIIYFNTPSVFCIYCDVVHVSPILTTNITTLEEKISFSLFPNPAKEELHLLTSQQDFLGMAEILDLTGTVIKQLKITQHKEVIDISNLSNGAYLIRLSNEKTSEMKFFVKAN